jgi:DNA-binding transcriptional MerR regulator
MKPTHIESLSLAELTDRANAELERSGFRRGPLDGRVNPELDARTIRYYMTLGLIDRPAMVGREARYQERHVLQLVAIKALQSFSRPLAAIQQELYGLSNSELAATIESFSRQAAAGPQAVASPVGWLELSVEAGLRIMVRDGWTPPADTRKLEEKIVAALAALKAPRGSNGGFRR